MNAPPTSALVVNVVELNPHAPRPVVFSEAALCLRDAIRAAGFRSEVCVNRSGIRFASYVNLVAACQELLRSPAEQAQRVLSAQRFARGLEFEQPFRVALGAMLRRLANLLLLGFSVLMVWQTIR
jgi:hypothetical protein